MSTEESLKLGAKNAKVARFRRLVESAKKDMSIDITEQSFKEETFDIELYDNAVSLPYSAIAFCPKAKDDAGDYQYGVFNGKQTFTIDGKIDQKNLNEQSGWITLNGQSSEYVYFKNNNIPNSYYIRITDFTAEAIISDFTPLYDALNKVRYSSDSTVSDDTKTGASVGTTHRGDTEKEINQEGDNQKLVEANNGSKVSSTGEQTKDNSQEVGYFGIYPQQIGTNKHDNKNDSVYNNIQAVIYDLPGYRNLEESASDLSNSIHQLFCYQQPDQISYTSAAQYDSPTTRGTQQPFQFYVQNNAMSLSFTLNWHIDEIRTLAKDSQTSYTIQDIAAIAEGFTRPWTTGVSVQPKLCKVILPGISEIGYITQAQISYSGPMSGDYTTGGGVLTSGSDSIPTARSIYNYFYSQISVAFEMIIVKDIKLHAATEKQAISMAIYGENEEIPVQNNVEAVQTNEDTNQNNTGTAQSGQAVSGNVEIPGEEVKATQEASGEQTAKPAKPSSSATNFKKEKNKAMPASENIYSKYSAYQPFSMMQSFAGNTSSSDDSNFTPDINYTPSDGNTSSSNDNTSSGDNNFTPDIDYTPAN